MQGRQLMSESQVPSHYQRPDFVRRREVLRETIQAFENRSRQAWRELALGNVSRWRSERNTQHGTAELRVFQGDWGEVTHDLTHRYGEIFAVLNMANAYVPGGGYVEGMPAQEENMFRRTDCHFSITSAEIVPSIERYLPEKTDLLNATHGRVYLDADVPRVCIRGAEDRQRPDLGYEWLSDEDVFPFYELRAAAKDLRGGGRFDPSDARRRIAAQLDTLVESGIAHVVLSAFGCGAFLNPAEEIASLYKEEIGRRRSSFHCVAFAIFYPGYGPDNWTPFRQILEG